MDKFPEAFRRFEQVVDVSKITSFQQLLTAFSHWAGRKWVGSQKQIQALKVEAERLGIPEVPVTLEEYIREKQLIDQLYRRVYYCAQRRAYNKDRLEEWERYYKRVRAQAFEEEWPIEEWREVEAWILKRVKASRRRVEYWEREWHEAYVRLKVEHERFVKKRVALGRMVK
ncbi:MAG: hypothetical protein QXQ63_05665 [Candidatus Bathyarchaeia archaeon]